MNVINGVLKSVPRDGNGFEDIDDFWKATEKLNYPLDSRLNTALFKSTRVSAATEGAEFSDNEFDYDTSASITDDDEEEAEDEEDEEDSDHDGDDREPNTSGATNRSGASASSKKTVKSSRSSAYSPLNESLMSIGLSPLGTDNSAVGRRSSGVSSDSNRGAGEESRDATFEKSDTLEDSAATEESFDPNSTKNSSRASAGTALSASPRASIAGPETSASRSKSDNNSLLNNSLLNSSGANMNDTGRSSRRVSFGLSPIERSGMSGKSRRGSSTGDGDGDNYMDDDDAPYDGEEEEGAGNGDEDDADRISSQQDTPVTSRSGRKSLSSSKTPLSASMNTSSSSRYSKMSTPGSREFARGRQVADDTFVDVDTDEEDGDSSAILSGRKRNLSDTVDESGLDESALVNDSYLYTIDSANKNYVEGRRQVKELAKAGVKRGKKSSLYNSDEDEELADTDNSEDGGDGLRRSRRATKGKKFAFWKGERPIYREGGTMVGLLQADPTPKKQAKKKRLVKTKEVRKGQGAFEGDEWEDERDAMPLPPLKLPDSVQYISRTDCEQLAVWNDSTEAQENMRVVCTAESLQPALALPRTAKRPAGRDRVGYAAHAFNMPEVPGVSSGWISGFVDLPPEAIKDAEGVGKYAQVFFVSDCQDGALELGIAHPKLDMWEHHTAQRLLLSKGDSFFVPPGNIYRLENHSASKSCMLFWTIIKPLEELHSLSLGDPSPSSTHAVAGVAGSGGSSSGTRGTEDDI